MDIYFQKRNLPVQTTPQSANWQLLPEFSTLAPFREELAKTQKVSYTVVSMIFNKSKWIANVYCNDEILIHKLEHHFELQNRGKEDDSYEDIKCISVLYLVDTKMVIGQYEVEDDPNIYRGHVSQDKTSFIVSSIYHVGIFKSAIIGCWSAQCLREAWLPVHSSIIVSPTGKGILFSGKANWGKTTTIFAVLSILLKKGYKALTDDWALVSLSSGQIVCVDKVVALRSDIIRDLPLLFDSPWLQFMMGKFAQVGGEKPELLLTETFGPAEITPTSVLAGVVSLSHTPLKLSNFEQHQPPFNKELLEITGQELAFHAYHCPDLLAIEGVPSVSSRYKELLIDAGISKLYTKETLPEQRKKQILELCAWIDGLE